MSVNRNSSGEAFLYCQKTWLGGRIGEDLHEAQSSLTIDSRSHQAILEFNRSPVDQPALPIGRFVMTVTPEWLALLRSAVDSVGLEALAPKRHAARYSAGIKIDVQIGEQTIEKRYRTDQRDVTKQLQPLQQLLNALQVQLFKHPESAIGIRVIEADEVDGLWFKLLISNIGKRPVLLADPRTANETSQHLAELKIAAAPVTLPGYTESQPEWQTLPLRPTQGRELGDQADLLLQPGQQVAVLSEAFVPQPGITYGVDAIYLSYAGAAETDGIYRIRGGIFSDRLRVDPS